MRPSAPRQVRFHRRRAASSLVADCVNPQRPPAICTLFLWDRSTHTHPKQHMFWTRWLVRWVLLVRPSYLKRKKVLMFVLGCVQKTIHLKLFTTPFVLKPEKTPNEKRLLQHIWRPVQNLWPLFSTQCFQTNLSRV